MSSLARYFLAGGYDVAGYDRVSTYLTNELIKEGAIIHYNDDPEEIPSEFCDKTLSDSTLVVVTPAIPHDNIELNFFRDNNFRILKRSQVLGIISDKMKTIAVAGTHGKTSISTMIAHILKQSDLDCTAFLGGVSKNYENNLILGKSDIAVLEADEFDRSFLQIHPEFAVISSVDADHLDIYGDKKQLDESFRLFISQIKKGGKLVIKKNLDLTLPENTDLEVYSYSLNQKADFYAKNIKFLDGFYVFDIIVPDGVIENVRLGFLGKMNVENAVAAIGISWILGVPEIIIKKAILCFTGVKRRFDVRFRSGKTVFIDDYAHHPVELNSVIASVREIFPGKQITGIFQPHLYSRTRDFSDEFAKSLEKLDRLILMDIYPAREKPIKGVSSELIYDKAKMKDKIILEKNEIIQYLRNTDVEVLLTLGAGDIDQLVSLIEEVLKGNENRVF